MERSDGGDHARFPLPLGEIMSNFDHIMVQATAILSTHFVIMYVYAVVKFTIWSKNG
jgi:hypothetical protein